MTCTICYENDARCEFVCGHSFCYHCVKTWYQKGSQTCPMCRGRMCFKGVLEAKKAWDCEKREKVLEEVVEELFEELEEHEYGVYILEFVHERYNTLLRDYPWIDNESLRFVLQSPWIQLVTQVDRVYDEFPTYTRYLMVPKTSYGVRSK